MAKNYSSFSSIAKTRFRGMAKELGYEQITGTIYVKSRGDWYEGFGLQASQYGNDFFYINYGVEVPNIWQPFDTEVDHKCGGYWISWRLEDDGSQGFPNATKDDVEKSAQLALKLYREQAVPCFAAIEGLEDIAERYFLSTSLKKENLGNHGYFDGLQAANYGLFLFKAKKYNDSLKWLKEAERLYSLPLYSTRDGRFVHEREKYSRIMKTEDYEVEQLNTIRLVISEVENA